MEDRARHTLRHKVVAERICTREKNEIDTVHHHVGSANERSVVYVVSRPIYKLAGLPSTGYQSRIEMHTVRLEKR
jgi:hypothetical protein